MTFRLSAAEAKQISALVHTYDVHQPQIKLFLEQLLLALTSSADLSKSIHSIRYRMKDRDHLRDKLERKLNQCKEERRAFRIRPDNLLVKINDLAGVRILHLYTRQIQQIDPALRDVLKENKYEIIEGPFARTWDDESRAFFRACGILTEESPTMYTSVHYVIGSSSRTKVTAEIQVRTLMEEVWGEVDHTMNYPHAVDSIACREQLKVLARVTSSASRLVDSIFTTVEDHARSSRSKAKRVSPRA